MKTSRRLHLVAIVVLSLSSIVLGVCLVVAVQQGKARLESQRASLESQRASLVKTANEALTSQSAELLKLSALPLAWAMRAALLKDDFQTVDTYLQRMIRQARVTGAALVGPDGRVRLAGNRTLEKAPVAQAFPGVSLAAEQPAVITTGADVQIVVPVMGLDRRLGTLILSYEVPLLAGWDSASH